MNYQPRMTTLSRLGQSFLWRTKAVIPRLQLQPLRSPTCAANIFFENDVLVDWEGIVPGEPVLYGKSNLNSIAVGTFVEELNVSLSSNPREPSRERQPYGLDVDIQKYMLSNWTHLCKLWIISASATPLDRHELRMLRLILGPNIASANSLMSKQKSKSQQCFTQRPFGQAR